MTGVSLGQPDVPGPEGPAAVARIPGEGGERVGRGEEDRRAAQQLGEEEESSSSLFSSSSCDVTSSLLLSANPVEELMMQDAALNWSMKDFYFETAVSCVQ